MKTDLARQSLDAAVVIFMEKAQRPGLLGLLGKTVARRCTKDLKEYFTALGKRIVEMRLESLAEPGRGISAEHARHAVAMRMHNLLRSRQPLLKALLHMNIVDAIAAAGKVSVLAEADIQEDDADDDSDSDDSQPTDYVGMTAEDAADYAKNKVDMLVTGLDQTSLNSIANAVSTGITERLGVPGTGKLIQASVDGMTTNRAQTIADYEMNDAMSQAFLKKLVKNAIAYKQWILGPNPCEICEENAEESPIPVDDEFPSGDLCPPAHVGCVCAVAGARAPKL
jgi:hypothetical protein